MYPRVDSGLGCCHLNKLQDASDERDAFEDWRSLTRQAIRRKPENAAHYQNCAGNDHTLHDEGQLVEKGADLRSRHL